MESLIDTSVLVDYILLDSEFHQRAETGIKKIERGFLPSVVVEELAYVLDRLKLSKEMVNEKIEEVLDTYGVIGITSANLQTACKMVMKENSISFKRFNDKLILAVAKERSMQLFTFDRDLIKECEANGVRIFQE
jgi:predicted nucleic acid-binding protein